MGSVLLLLAILSISSSSLISAANCFPRSSPYAVPISALETGFQFFPYVPHPQQPSSQPPATPPIQKSPPPVQKPTPPTPSPEVAPSPSDVPSVATTMGSGAFNGAFISLINSLCAKTDEPELCVSYIKPRVGTVKVPYDETGVLKLAMLALTDQTSLALKAARKYLADPKTDKLSAEALKDCLDSYDDAKYSLRQVEAALKSGDRGTVGSFLSSAGTDYDTCENGFDDFGIDSLMGASDAQLMKLNSICLAIAKAANLMD